VSNHGSHNPLAEFADDLDELRRLAGLSYRELARRTRCPRSTLNDALTGRRFPGLTTVLSVVRVCGGDPMGWRSRWAAAKRLRSTDREASTRVQVLGMPPDQVEHALSAWARVNGVCEPRVVRISAPRSG
jgi:transcriptional regulator with XRE-family HTH domain